MAATAAAVARTRVCSAIPGDNDSEAVAAVGTCTVVAAAVQAAVGICTVVEAAVQAAAEVQAAAVDKRQVVVRNPVGSVADTVEGVAVRNSGVDNPADYTAPVVRILAAVAPAGVRWEYDPRLPTKRKQYQIKINNILF